MTGQVRAALVRVDKCAVHPHNVRRDLGDLRPLMASIARFGVMQPIVVEARGTGLRLRAGHRRLAAVQLLGKSHIPAIIHSDSLEVDEWLVQAVQENVMRRGLDADERRDAIQAMRAEAMSQQGIAQAFGVSPATIRTWERPTNRATPARSATSARSTRVGRPALRLLVDHLDELVDAGAELAQLLDAVRSYAETLRLPGAESLAS